jgi:hypothetical protein
MKTLRLTGSGFRAPSATSQPPAKLGNFKERTIGIGPRI